jgi:hypothetical protein
MKTSQRKRKRRLWIRNWLALMEKTDEEYISGEFRRRKTRIKADVLPSLPMVSLTLFFSSLLPCLLHVCLYIWSASSSESDSHSIRHGIMKNSLAPTITAQLSRFIPPSWSAQWAETWHALVGTMQKEGIDEMWVVVRLLAGMSSGFGLRGESSQSGGA